VIQTAPKGDLQDEESSYNRLVGKIDQSQEKIMKDID
jgi:hypothetical protein